MRFFGFIFLFLFLFSSLKGQRSDTESLNNKLKIIFTGNKRTRDAYLSRFIHSSTGTETDSLILMEDLRRLRTLPGIMSAEAQIQDSDTGKILRFNLEERWTLLPVGDFGISEDSYWVGAGAMEYNAFGQGIYLYGYVQYKTPFALQIIARYPYIMGSKTGLEYQTQYFEANENPLVVNYDGYKFSEHRISGKYEIVYEKDLLLGVAHTIEKIENGEEQIDTKKSVRVLAELRFQRLNYHHFIIDGWHNNFIFSYRMPYTQQRNSIDFYNELKLYKSFERLNLACRIAFGLSTEQESYYMPYVVDNYKNFRGSGYRTYKVNQMAMCNLESRITLFENAIGGIQTVLFSDIGKISSWISLDKNRLNENLLYAGPGIRFIYKKAYNAVLSIDYGFNLHNMHQGGWVIGWGQYF